MLKSNHHCLSNIFNVSTRILSCFETSQLDMLPIYLSELSRDLNYSKNTKIKNDLIIFLASIPEFIQYIFSKYEISSRFFVASKSNARNITKSTHDYQHEDCTGLVTIIDIREINRFGLIEHNIYHTYNTATIHYWDGWLANIAIPVMRRACDLLRFETSNSFELHWNIELYELSSRTVQLASTIEPYKVTLLTSMFNGEKYLNSFINNLAMSPFFKSVNLIIFDANTSDKDLEHLAPFLARYKNIKYLKLKSDPGLYEIWNLGIHMSKTEYIGNANLDDRRHPLQLEALISELDKNKDLDLVSTHVVPMHDYTADIYSFKESAPYIFYSWMEGTYTIRDLFKIEGDHIQSNCIPHCMPIWRKRIHEKCGYFNESNNRSAADFELWLRGIDLGLTFSIVPIPASYYYVNPNSYMRCDTGHENIAAHLHSIYISRTIPSPLNYIPDFAYLESLIDFSIN